MSEIEESQRSEPGSLAWRLAGAIRLAGPAFEDVERDRGAMAQAAGVVVVAGLARGLGEMQAEGLLGLLLSPLLAIVMWLSAGVLIWGVGVKRFHYSADYPELLRTIGFAAAPLFFLALGVLPLGVLHTGLWWLAHGWATLALVVAVREALDVTPARALVVCAVALAVAITTVVVVSLFVVAGFE
jgi:hypothetical protein